MKSESTLYIPDISGFTQFVNDTEIEHGQRITAALLEEIINSNYMNFVVSEIEGDSVLFYKSDYKPDVQELMELSLNIFKRFHLKRNELNESTHCNCGACSSINNLTLKFIILSGEVSTIRIHNFNKLYGRSVILVHRLLKSGIREKEFILFTGISELNLHNSNNHPELSEPKLFIQNFEDISLVKGVYFVFNSFNGKQDES